MTSNIRAFTADLRKSQREAGELHLRFQKRIALEALGRVVQKTPVDTGRARGGWQAGERDSEAETGRLDTLGGATEAAGLSAINAVSEPFGVIVIFNNVRYIVFLEEGSSQQAPQGMVATTIRELEGALGEALGAAGLRFSLGRTDR